MEEIIQQAIDDSRADYLEIRLEDRQTTNITFRGKTLDEISSRHSTGGYVRALVKGGWGYACFTDLKKIPQICQKAQCAASLVRNGTVELAPLEPRRETIKPDFRKDPRDVPIEDKEALVHRYNDIIMSGERIQTSVLYYNEVTLDKSIYTSEGVAIREESMDMTLIANALAKEGSRVQSIGEIESSALDFGKLEGLDEKIEKLTKRAASLLDAKPPVAGRYDIVIDPVLTGVFSHEAFGHLSEADFVSENESLTDIMKLGRRFGNSRLNIIDDGTLRDLPGCSKYDDEGVPTQKTYLIKDGILNGRLHNRETAARMGEAPSGNARSVNFFYRPVVRMTCTYTDAGDWDKEEMIREIDDGYYVKGSKGGQTNLEMFTFSGEEAFRIEDGEITDHVRDINLSGNLFETLENIDAVGRDLELKAGGSCGKGEHYPLPVSHGGPHIRIKNVVIGGG